MLIMSKQQYHFIILLIVSIGYQLGNIFTEVECGTLNEDTSVTALQDLVRQLTQEERDEVRRLVLEQERMAREV